MVGPSPNIERKIRNTKNLIDQNKEHLISEYVKNEPQNYISKENYDKLNTFKPWIDEVKPIKNIKSLQQPIRDNILVICIDFSDRPAQIPISVIQNRFFSTTGKTLRNYYAENSYGTYIPEGEVHGWYRAPQPYSYYVNYDYGGGTYPHNIWKMVEDIVDIIAYDQTINFSYIDKDNNLYIDNLIIVHSGDSASGSGSANDLWSMVTSIDRRLVNGYEYQFFALVSEYLSYPTSIQRCGVDAHEFAHLLGLPDLYDLQGNSLGTGIYSLMSNGSWGSDYGVTPVHLDAWCKNQLKFTTTITDLQGLVTINNAELNNINYLYTTQYQNEYFLIENRQKMLFDSGLPADGLLIWKINELQYSNFDETCFKVGLIQADGLHDLENFNNVGDSGDSYPGSTNNHSFGRITNPSSLLCDGSYPDNDLYIINISNSGNVMTFEAIMTCSPLSCSLIIQG
ncbi:MAG: M6 family metalloprotease domain-containing protein [Methanobacteriota archaeon]